MEAHRLRKAMAGVLDQRAALSEGLRPYPDGWRARKRYVEQTNAVIDDPTGRLPHYPMVLHRGGWPDGSWGLAPEHVGLDRLGLSLHPQLGHPLDERAGRQPADGRRAEHDLAHRRFGLEPGGEVDRVTDDAVLAVPARPADQAGQHLAAVDAGAEAWPVGMIARYGRGRRLEVSAAATATAG